MSKYRIITTEDRKCQVIDVGTGEDISPKLSRLTLHLEPQDFRLELVFVDYAPELELECEVEVTCINDRVRRFKHVHPSGRVTIENHPPAPELA